MRASRVLAFLIVAANFLAVSAASLRAATVNVSGDLDWTDGQGNLHDAREVKVELYSKDFAGSLTLEASTTADFDGHYSTSFSANAPGFLDCYLRIYTQTSAGFVASGTFGPIDTPDSSTTYDVRTPDFGVGSGNNFINLAIPNTTDAGRAFAVADMMLVGRQFSANVRGTPLDPIGVRFPHTVPPAPNSSFYSRFRLGIFILGGDRFDPDVQGHEYSHYLHEVDALTNQPGGPHFFGVSNIPADASSINGKKSAGIRLAWGEGVGNYMGVAMQNINAAANKYPTSYASFGDTDYTDSINQNFTFSLESAAGSAVQGEGEEVSVARILWDLGDAKNEPHDRVERGHVQVYKDLVSARDRIRTATGNNNARLETLSQVNDWYQNVASANDVDRINYGAIYEKYEVSPHPVGPLIGSTVNPALDNITFDWTRQNNGMSDTFRLMVWNSDFSLRLINNFLIPGDVTTYTLTLAQKLLLAPGLGTTLNFALIGSDLKDSTNSAYPGLESTGGYWSDAYQFTLIPEPASLFFMAVGLLTLRRGRRGR